MGDGEKEERNCENRRICTRAMLSKTILGPHLLSHEMLGPGLRPSMGGPVRYITSAASHSYGGWHVRVRKEESKFPVNS